MAGPLGQAPLSHPSGGISTAGRSHSRLETRSCPRLIGTLWTRCNLSPVEQVERRSEPTDAYPIPVPALPALSIDLLVWIEIPSPRNAAATEQNSSPVA